jgi:hypothetical protein
MRAITWDEFADAVGTAYRVDHGESAVELTLDQAAEIASAGREAGSFRLEFVGPANPLLPQAIYSFWRGDELFEIFIVPIAQDRQGSRYEAIFY